MFIFYDSTQGKAGPNEVLSFVCKYLKDLLDSDELGRLQLVLVMNGCGAQNKNQFVIDLCAELSNGLSAMGWFESVVKVVMVKVRQ